MLKAILEMFMIQSILMLLIFFVIYLLSKMNRSLRYEKRIGSFAIEALIDTEVSFFDSLRITFEKIVKYMSKFLNKFLKNTKKYEKYINYETEKNKETSDYISIKILISLFFVLGCAIFFNFKSLSLSILMLLVSMILGYYIYDIFLVFKFSKYKKELEDDLIKAIVIMNNSFKAGKNVIGAITSVIKQLEGPIKNEFKKIDQDISYGLSLDLAFNRFYERTHLSDAKYISSSTAILNRIGGDIASVFTNIEKSIYRRKRLRDELKTLTASSNFMFKFLIILPIVLIVILLILSPAYFNILFENILGVLTLILMILIYALYIYTIKKVMRVSI